MSKPSKRFCTCQKASKWIKLSTKTIKKSTKLLYVCNGRRVEKFCHQVLSNCFRPVSEVEEEIHLARYHSAVWFDFLDWLSVSIDHFVRWENVIIKTRCFWILRTLIITREEHLKMRFLLHFFELFLLTHDRGNSWTNCGIFVGRYQ